MDIVGNVLHKISPTEKDKYHLISLIMRNPKTNKQETKTTTTKIFPWIFRTLDTGQPVSTLFNSSRLMSHIIAEIPGSMDPNGM